MSISVELTRQEWEEGYRRVEARAGEPAVYARLLGQVEAVTEEIRRRIGVPFTLDELAEVYAGSERWSKEAIGERDTRAGWAPSAVTAADAAFHLYARGARDYRP
jgi:hypothetical protein